MEYKVLAVQDLSVGYKDSMVLENICFSAQKGELVGIIGQNGAGKSTLLKALRGLLTPKRGVVYIEGEPISSFTDKQFARKAAYLQQQTAVSFGYRACDIVLAGRYPYLAWWQKEGKADMDIIEACMEYTGVWNLADTPFKLLSGGQQQRVLLAKVLAQQTPLLFLDEPATGLDIFYQEEIFRLCQELCSVGKTIFMVVHELSLAARFCSRLLLVGHKKLLADGAPALVLTEEHLQNAYKTKVKVVENPRTGHLEIFTEDMRVDERHSALQKIAKQMEGKKARGESVENKCMV